LFREFVVEVGRVVLLLLQHALGHRRRDPLVQHVLPVDVLEEGVVLDGGCPVHGSQPGRDLPLQQLPDQVLGVLGQIRRQEQFAPQDFLYCLLAVVTLEGRLEFRVRINGYLNATKQQGRDKSLKMITSY
jgi:hypothetical protein